MITASCRCALLACCLLLLGNAGAPAWAQPPAEPPPPAPLDAAGLVDLNRAIKAYLEEDRDTAAEIFERLLTQYPQADFRAACRYYLGLIALERGLSSSAAAEAANAQKLPDVAEREATLARVQFEQAQTHFQEVVDVTDPSAEMINAALLLGISQLASDYPGAAEGDPQAAFHLAQRAEETLTRYVTLTEPGTHDRYGHFYLAVARYRLADTYRDQPGRGREYAESLAEAKRNLSRAAALAVDDRAAGRLPPDAFDSFQTVVTYYDALLAVLERDYRRARREFGEVTERAAGTGLAENALTIVNKLNEVETASPAPIQLPIPGPIGPLEVEGRIRMGNWWNSNVILLGKDTQLPRGFRSKEGYQFGLSADLNISRYISKNEAPWVGESLTIGFGGGTANLWQPSIPQFDVNRYPARVYVNWQPVRDLYLGVQYEYSYTQLGHEPFISSQRITPVISKTWRGLAGEDGAAGGAELGRTDLYYSYDIRNYLDRLTNWQLNRDGQYQALGARHTFNLVQARNLPYLAKYFASHERERMLFGDQWLYCYLGYEYRDERTVGTEFDQRGHSLLWGLNVPLPYRFSFGLDGEFAWADYTGASLFDFSRKERADFIQRYDFGLTYAIITRGEYAAMRTLDVKLRGGIELTFQNSNIWDRLGQDVYEYDRAVYGVQLEVGF